MDNDDHIGIPQETVLQTQNKGITTITDLVEFDKDTTNQISDNLYHPSGRIPDLTSGAAVGAKTPTPPFMFGAKSQNIILTACDLMRYHKTTTRPLTPGNISWNPIMRNFT